MLNILGSIGLAYLAGSGSVTNTSVVGRGLFRAGRHVADGAFREAGIKAVAAARGAGADELRVDVFAGHGRRGWGV